MHEPEHARDQRQADSAGNDHEPECRPCTAQHGANIDVVDAGNPDSDRQDHERQHIVHRPGSEDGARLGRGERA